MTDPEGIGLLPRAHVIVRPAWSEGFDHEDNTALVSELMGTAAMTADQIEFRLGYLHGDFVEPGWTWVEFVLDKTAVAVIDAIVVAIGVWGRRWYKRVRQRHPDARPLKATIYGPNGEVLRYVEVPPEH